MDTPCRHCDDQKNMINNVSIINISEDTMHLIKSIIESDDIKKYIHSYIYDTYSVSHPNIIIARMEYVYNYKCDFAVEVTLGFTSHVLYSVIMHVTFIFNNGTMWYEIDSIQH